MAFNICTKNLKYGDVLMISSANPIINDNVIIKAKPMFFGFK